MKRRTVCILALATAMTLSACGFHLRGANGEANLPFKTIYVGIPESSQLGVELKRYLRASGDTSLVTDPKAAQALAKGGPVRLRENPAKGDYITSAPPVSPLSTIKKRFK